MTKDLTRNQFRVLKHLANHKTRAEIATLENISEGGVRCRIEGIGKKLNARTANEILARAYELQLVDSPCVRRLSKEMADVVMASLSDGLFWLHLEDK